MLRLEYNIPGTLAFQNISSAQYYNYLQYRAGSKENARVRVYRLPKILSTPEELEYSAAANILSSGTHGISCKIVDPDV